MITTSPERLYLMQLASMSMPAVAGSMLWSAGCYLVVMGDGTRLLIDSGLPDDVPQPPGTSAEGVRTNVIDQLGSLGVRPDDIDLVVCTHFDVDHAGYHDTFSHAEFVVQREHYERARSGDPRYAAARAHWDHPALRYRLVDGDTELLPGVTLLKTSGHAPGHQSVLLRLPRTGPVLLAIDAVVMERLFTPDRPAWPNDDDEEQLRASTRKLLDLVEREQVALVVFGHDGAHWQSLRKPPDCYE